MISGFYSPSLKGTIYIIVLKVKLTLGSSNFFKKVAHPEPFEFGKNSCPYKRKRFYFIKDLVGR